MGLINTDGLTLIGPGSEWLWIALQFVALSVTGLAIFRQVRAQAWSNSLVIGVRLADEWRHDLLRTKLRALMDVARSGSRMTPAIEKIGEWFDAAGVGIFSGYIPARMGWEQWGDAAQIYWATFGPARAAGRRSDPTLWKGWERWIDDIVARDRKAGRSLDVSPSTLARRLPETIAFHIEMLRAEEEAKLGVIPEWPPAGSAEPVVTADVVQAPA